MMHDKLSLSCIILLRVVNVSIKKPKQLKRYKGFFTYFLTALFGASVNFVSQIVYRGFLSFSNSVLLGYLTAMVVSFLPAKLFAFAAKETGNTTREGIKYMIIAFLALAVQVYSSKYMLEWIANPLFPDTSMFWREKTAHVVGMGFSFMANFFGHKLLTFRSTGVYNRLRSRTFRN